MRILVGDTGYTRTWIYITLLKCTLKVVKIVLCLSEVFCISVRPFLPMLKKKKKFDYISEFYKVVFLSVKVIVKQE